MIEQEPQKSAVTSSKASDNRADKVIDPNQIQAQSMQNSKFELLSGYLDGELTQQEAQKVMLLLETDESYRQLYDEMVSMRQEVQSLSLQESELEHLDRLFEEPVAKTSRIFGLALVAITSTIIVAYILYSVLLHAAMSLFLKIAIGLLCLGSLFLLFSVLRQRMISSKKDKYNRVKL